MNKKIFVAIIVIIVIIIGTKVIFIDKNKNVKIDISKLAAELLDSQIFEDNLDEIDKETVIKRYGFVHISLQIFYKVFSISIT